VQSLLNAYIFITLYKYRNINYIFPTIEERETKTSRLWLVNFMLCWGDNLASLGILIDTSLDSLLTKFMHPVILTAFVIFEKLFMKLNIVYLKTQQKFTNK
jgi:hypothetical protein